MASAAPAYRYDYGRQTAPRPQQRPQVHVVPGRREVQTVSSTFITAMKLFMVALAVFAVIGCVRIALSAATVNTMVASESITAQTNTLRSSSTDLEVRETSLAGSNHIKTAAAQLDMAAATDTTVLTLPADVVALDSNGNLSLSKSFAVAAQG